MVLYSGATRAHLPPGSTSCADFADLDERAQRACWSQYVVYNTQCLLACFLSRWLRIIDLAFGVLGAKSVVRRVSRYDDVLLLIPQTTKGARTCKRTAGCSRGTGIRGGLWTGFSSAGLQRPAALEERHNPGSGFSQQAPAPNFYLQRFAKQPTYKSYPLSPQKRVLKQSVCSKLGKKVVEVGWVHTKVEDHNSMKRGQ
jgi:hypothetical protein